MILLGYVNTEKFFFILFRNLGFRLDLRFGPVDMRRVFWMKHLLPVYRKPMKRKWCGAKTRRTNLGKVAGRRGANENLGPWKVLTFQRWNDFSRIISTIPTAPLDIGRTGDLAGRKGEGRVIDPGEVDKRWPGDGADDIGDLNHIHVGIFQWVGGICIYIYI